MSGIWWLSFATPEGHLGIVVTEDLEGDDIGATTQRMWRMGLNPGGEVLGWLATREQVEERCPWALENMDRLISADELEAAGVATHDPREPS